MDVFRLSRGKIVQNDNVVALPNQAVNQVGSDKSSSSGNKNLAGVHAIGAKPCSIGSSGSFPPARPPVFRKDHDQCLPHDPDIKGHCPVFLVYQVYLQLRGQAAPLIGGLGFLGAAAPGQDTALVLMID